MTFGYSHVEAKSTTGGAGFADLPGYEGFDETLHTMALSPNHSVDEEQTDLFDVNSDGLPDVLVTAAGVYGSGHGAFFNGPNGNGDTFGQATPVCVNGVLGADAGTLSLKNPNVAPLDLDGDGIVDLLHAEGEDLRGLLARLRRERLVLGRAQRDRCEQPKRSISVRTRSGQVMDVNFDGLVDVVVTVPRSNVLALGRPGGSVRQRHPTGPAASLSTEPVRTCVPWSATPVRFSDPDIKVADMNGDGISDIVRVRKGDIRYWPGRGNGFWGTGKRDDCGAGTFGANRHVMMATSPQYSDIQGESLRLDDVNGDGLTDLVQVRFTDVDVWLNVDGAGWTDRHIIKGTPASPSYANRVRLVDVNGSGTRDICGGRRQYRYMDLAGASVTGVDQGGERPRQGHEPQYSTSVSEMLAAEKTGVPWTKRMPTVTHVVKTVSDRQPGRGRQGPATYVTEYSYADPVYGTAARVPLSRAPPRLIGDANSPADVTGHVPAW